jgi:hypothetical protein
MLTWWPKWLGNSVSTPEHHDEADLRTEDARLQRVPILTAVGEGKSWDEAPAACRSKCVKCEFWPGWSDLPSHGCLYDPKKDLLVIRCHRCRYRWTEPPADRGVSAPNA